jgi:hypothetical protein
MRQSWPWSHRDDRSPGRRAHRGLGRQTVRARSAPGDALPARRAVEREVVRVRAGRLRAGAAAAPRDHPARSYAAQRAPARTGARTRSDTQLLPGRARGCAWCERAEVRANGMAFEMGETAPSSWVGAVCLGDPSGNSRKAACKNSVHAGHRARSWQPTRAQLAPSASGGCDAR